MSLRSRAREATKREASDRANEMAALEAPKVAAFQAARAKREAEFRRAINAWARSLGTTVEGLIISATRIDPKEGSLLGTEIVADIRALFQCEGIKFFATYPELHVRLDRMGIDPYAGTPEERIKAWKEIHTLADLDGALATRNEIKKRFETYINYTWSQKRQKKKRTRRLGDPRDPNASWH